MIVDIVRVDRIAVTTRAGVYSDVLPLLGSEPVEHFVVEVDECLEELCTCPPAMRCLFVRFTLKEIEERLKYLRERYPTASRRRDSIGAAGIVKEEKIDFPAMGVWFEKMDSRMASLLEWKMPSKKRKCVLDGSVD